MIRKNIPEKEIKAVYENHNTLHSDKIKETKGLSCYHKRLL